VQLLLQSIGFGVITAAVVAIGAMGFTLQFGLTNILNISYAAVMTLGAFAALLAERAGLGVAAEVLAAAAAGVAISLLVGTTLLRFFARRGAGLFEMVMVTLALNLVIEYAVDAAAHEQLYQFSFPQGATQRFGVLSFTVTQLVLIGAAAGIFLALEGLLRLTRLGRALRAMAAEPRLARACGIPTGRIVNVTWLISGALAGLAGLAWVTNSLTVDSSVGTTFLPLVIAAAILGKASSLRGAVLASLVLGIVNEVVSSYGGSAYSQVAAFGILALVLLTRPAGLAGDAINRAEITI
jgi:branched-chain amino acid transport system permease protein/neutral amino acid transport system permease protein